MAKIDINDIQHVAQLARLKLASDANKYCRELESILSYIKELEKVSTKAVMPISQIIGLKNISRSDKINPSLPLVLVLKNAPQKEDNYIKTKQVFE